ncbi:hypothetical protein [Xanthobacter aminoxidans]|uniref:hypothetical protein n=1 Tax=Xanthobacter aminoxidans TaxID=186280 RepID=UPI002022E517|nr:hypothetical protein [Xanthobacter aminoxidans]MCL8385853.1 hypothetical protein [Xanthobacter aminoxidans]
MCSNSLEARLAIDWDGDGAYAVITRPGAAAEVIRLPDADRLATEAMAAALALRGRVVVRPTCKRSLQVGDVLPHFIGALGE